MRASRNTHFQNGFLRVRIAPAALCQSELLRDRERRHLASSRWNRFGRNQPESSSCCQDERSCSVAELQPPSPHVSRTEGLVPCTAMQPAENHLAATRFRHPQVRTTRANQRALAVVFVSLRTSPT